MTPAEHAQRVLDDTNRRAQQARDLWDNGRANRLRLTAERRGMTEDASVIRFDDPDRKPMMA